MHNKKVVFFLLLILITAAMCTLMYHKYILIPSGKNPNYSQISDQQVKELMNGKKGCVIQAGLPIGIKSLLPGQFEIVNLISVPQEEKSKFNIGDIILGSGFIAEGDEVGKIKSIDIYNHQTRTNSKVNYKVILYSNCY